MESATALVTSGHEGPFLMLNLLKFKETAEYPDGRDAEISGREAYDRYGIAVSLFLFLQCTSHVSVAR